MLCELYPNAIITPRYFDKSTDHFVAGTPPESGEVQPKSSVLFLRDNCISTILINDAAIFAV